MKTLGGQKIWSIFSRTFLVQQRTIGAARTLGVQLIILLPLIFTLLYFTHFPLFRNHGGLVYVDRNK